MKLLLTSAGLAALIAGALPAQTPPAPANMPPSRMAPRPITRTDVDTMVTRHFAEMDANRDGAVTRAEFDSFEAARRANHDSLRKAHRDREFARLDADRDGSVSKGEFDAAPPPPPPGGPRGPGNKGPMHGPGMMAMSGPRWFDRADTNRDGKVTLAEASATALAMFDRRDTNHDGTISPDEMRAMRMRGPDGGPGGDMPPPR